MNNVNVLVTGVGAIIGYGIIKSLEYSGKRINTIGTDIYADAVGQTLCDKFIQAEPAASADYLDFLREVIDDNSIDIVFFGTEQELYRVDAARAEMSSTRSEFVMNTHELLYLSKDKWLTQSYLRSHGLGGYAIPSVIEGDYHEIAARFGESFLLKPRSSYASKGIVTVTSEEEFCFFRNRMGENFMAQQLIGDAEHEYTVAVFGLGDGTYSGKISLRRKLSQEGATAKAWTVDDDRLNAAVDEICSAFKPIGPTNLQFRMDGCDCYLLEVNPRISSSTSIRARLGYNEADMSLDYFLNGIVQQPLVKSGYALRYIDEVVVLA